MKVCGPGGVRAIISENLLLEQQLIVLGRSRRRAPNLQVGDRLLFGVLSLFLSPERIRKVAIGLRPATLLAFHRAFVRRKYRRLFSSSHRPRKPGPTGPSEALVQAIVELKSRNPRFGCPRIARIMSRTFGVDKNLVRRVLAKHYRPHGGDGPSWLSFIGHATDSLWSVDLFRCESIVLQSYWVLVVMDQCTRRIIGLGVHHGDVDGAHLCRMFNEAIRGRGTPRHLSTDYDPLFEAHRWQATLRVLEIGEIKTVPHVPMSHPFVERLIGTLRREFLDHVFLECPGSGAEACGRHGLLQFGAGPRRVGRPHAVRLRPRTSGGSCPTQQGALDLALRGARAAPHGSVTRNSRRSGLSGHPYQTEPPGGAEDPASKVRGPILIA